MQVDGGQRGAQPAPPGVLEGFTFESDITVPADVPPGLYGVWVVLDEPGGSISDCENILHGKRAAAVLKGGMPDAVDASADQLPHLPAALPLRGLDP